ncbi:right-handed parallel beta-helix repeat-containing protein, partial [Magnetococcales bacterium HHB-1]
TEDLAGLKSEAAILTHQALPDRRFLKASELIATIPSRIEGIAKMVAGKGAYTISKKVEITPEATLLIEPGVEIILQGEEAGISVYGEIRGYGQRKKPILVRGERGHFERFLHLRSKKPIWLQGMIFQEGGIPITMEKGIATIHQCQFIKSRYSALEIKGTAKPEISESVFKQSGGSAIIIEGFARPRFRKNLFNDNLIHIQNGTPYTIDAKKNRWLKARSIPFVGKVDHN